MAFIKKVIRNAIWKLVVCALGCKKKPYIDGVKINGAVYTIKIEKFVSIAEQLNEYRKILRGGLDKDRQTNKASEQHSN